MGPSNGNGSGDGARAGQGSGELDAAVAALVAVLDEALAIATDRTRPLTGRAERLARVGRSMPPARFDPRTLPG